MTNFGGVAREGEAAPAARPCVLPDAARGMGVFVCATRGTGKSRLLGRSIAWQDFCRDRPLVVIDPLGGTIDNLLDKIGRQPLRERRKLWERVRYVDMNGRDGTIVPWPIYYEAYPDEQLSAQSQRFVEVVARADPALQHAAIQGFNAFAPIAQAAGIVLTGLGAGDHGDVGSGGEPARVGAAAAGAGVALSCAQSAPSRRWGW